MVCKLSHFHIDLSFHQSSLITSKIFPVTFVETSRFSVRPNLCIFKHATPIGSSISERSCCYNRFYFRSGKVFSTGKKKGGKVLNEKLEITGLRRNKIYYRGGKIDMSSDWRTLFGSVCTTQVRPFPNGWLRDYPVDSV